uniref:Uncharacterized protein n=1 Tax=Phlebotomus papatasi TaxID=29031 RepID=A0A1B0D4W0_PHLPP
MSVRNLVMRVLIFTAVLALPVTAILVQERIVVAMNLSVSMVVVTVIKKETRSQGNWFSRLKLEIYGLISHTGNGAIMNIIK